MAPESVMAIPSPAVSRDKVSLTRRGPANDVAGCRVDQDAVCRVGDLRGAGLVGADEIALEGIHVGLEVDGDAVLVSRDHVIGYVVNAGPLNEDPLEDVAHGRGSGRVETDQVVRHVVADRAGDGNDHALLIARDDVSAVGEAAVAHGIIGGAIADEDAGVVAFGQGTRVVGADEVVLDEIVGRAGAVDVHAGAAVGNAVKAGAVARNKVTVRPTAGPDNVVAGRVAAVAVDVDAIDCVAVRGDAVGQDAQVTVGYLVVRAIQLDAVDLEADDDQVVEGGPPGGGADRQAVAVDGSKAAVDCDQMTGALRAAVYRTWLDNGRKGRGERQVRGDPPPPRS